MAKLPHYEFKIIEGQEVLMFWKTSTKKNENGSTIIFSDFDFIVFYQ